MGRRRRESGRRRIEGGWRNRSRSSIGIRIMIRIRRNNSWHSSCRNRKRGMRRRIMMIWRKRGVESSERRRGRGRRRRSRSRGRIGKKKRRRRR